MTDAYENENLPQEGQPVDNVGQDEGQTGAESSGQNLEEQVKYFQSEKDKLYNENQKLRDYEKVGKMLESRPDIVNAVSGMLQGGEPANQQEQRISLDKDEFDPWKAGIYSFLYFT